MALLQAQVPDAILARLDRYRASMEFKPARTTLVVCAVNDWLDAHELPPDAKPEPSTPDEVACD